MQIYENIHHINYFLLFLSYFLLIKSLHLHFVHPNFHKNNLKIPFLILKFLIQAHYHLTILYFHHFLLENFILFYIIPFLISSYDEKQENPH